MRRFEVRKDYILVSVTVLVFAISSAFSLYQVNRASVTLAHEYPLAIWTIEQFQNEHKSLLHALELHTAGVENRDEVLQAFEILWNRATVVLDGYEASFARESLGAQELATGVLNVLKRYDAKVQAIPDSGAPAVSSDVFVALSKFKDPIHELNIRNFHDRDAVYGLSGFSEHLRAAGIAFFGLVVSGLVLVVMLIRQFRASHQLALHDSLTGLANRRYFMDHLEQIILRAERYDESFAVYLIDLNEFKPINDKYGHLFGDHVLRVFAQRLSNCVRRVDIASRLGGDEFAVIQYPVKEAREVPAMSDRLHDGLAGPVSSKSLSTDVTHSMGVALYPLDGRTAEELLYAADMKMYGAKKVHKRRLKSICSSLQVGN
ncbi:diguanylate cyclase [Pontibacterium granulatum]|uniref:diguanylate cyclase n=1 Tax=Pontibacterium granulatum TaxID=2036029 RepID=UPI002499CF6B|nr:diguanylate cyclase [Pontibacterium granulatum]MDI3324097.1 diguanylate cyclase [Pontibacterium granulatum]